MIIINEIKLSFKLQEIGFTAKITSSPESKGNLIIPSSIQHQGHEYIITDLDEGLFQNNENIKTVTFSAESHFRSIPNYAFYTSSLEIITIPDSVTTIGTFSFAWCNSLRQINFSKNSKLHSIQKQAFFLSNLDSLELPSNVSLLESGWCNGFSLKKLMISENNRNFFYSKEKLLFGKSDSKSDIFDTIEFASRDIQKVKIPSEITKIASFAFASCHDLKTVEFESNSKINSIDEWSFYSTAIECISIPSTVKKIESKAFAECRCLKTIKFSEDSELNFVGSQLFYNSSLKNLMVPQKVSKMGRSFFFQCLNLESIEFLGDDLVFIERTFVGCANLSIVLFSRARKVTFGMDVFHQISEDCRLFFVSGAEVDIEILL